MAVKNLQATKRIDPASRLGRQVNFGLDLYCDIPLAPRGIPVPMGPPRVLTPIDLDAIEAEEIESENKTDICKVCHVQHERPVAFS